MRIYILDAAGKANVPVNGTITVTRDVDGSSFELDPEKPGENGAAESYTLDNKELSIAMNLGVTVDMKVGDKTYSGKIKASKPHKH